MPAPAPAPEKIYDFAVTACLEDVQPILDRQISYNTAISQEGLRSDPVHVLLGGLRDYLQSPVLVPGDNPDGGGGLYAAPAVGIGHKKPG